MPEFANPLLCAVDRADEAGALQLARAVAPVVGGLKLGLEFFTANGPQGVAAMREIGLPLFLDLKLHDIPNTVGGAARAAARLEVAMLTLHAAGGRAMLRAAVEALADEVHRPWLLGVTVLSSLDADDLTSTGVHGDAVSQSLRLGELCLLAGLDGLVCSPREIAPLRRTFGRNCRLVVPGIRASGSADDQKRTMAPAEALAAGADLLIVGRPITATATPAAAARALVQSLRPAA